MNKPVIKVQINSLEALEHIMGADPEFVLEIKNNVAQAIAGRYLKGVAQELINTGEMKQIQDAAQKHSREYAEKMLEKVHASVVQVTENSWRWGAKEFKLRPEVVKELQLLAHEEVRAQFKKALDAVMQDQRFQNEIKNAVKVQALTEARNEVTRKFRDMTKDL